MAFRTDGPEERSSDPMRLLEKFRPCAGWLTLLFIAPVAMGALRHSDFAFVPLILLIAAACYLFFERLWRPEDSFTLGACLVTLYMVTTPGVLAGAGARYYTFYYLLVFFVFAQLTWIAGRSRALRVALMALSAIVVSIGLVFAAHAALAGALPSRTVLFTIYQTDYEEALAYITEVVGTAPAVTMTALLLAQIALLARAGSLVPRLSVSYHAVMVVPVALGLWATADASNELRVLSAAAEYRNLLHEYRRVAAERRTATGQIEANRTRAGAEVHIVVIGESTTRNHMGLYGYFRDTTPRLSGMADNLVVFTDVISSHSHTMHALQKALTLADVENRLEYTDPDAYSIIELLKAAGVRTYWLSNQKRYGLWDNHASVLAEAADHVRFVSRRLGKRVQPGPDARVLPAVRAALRDGRNGGAKVIFIHLMGTHWPYQQRTDRRHTRFTGPLDPDLVGGLELDDRVAAQVNHYDNAVLYADFILKRLIDLLEQDGPAVTSLLYFSDHGESPLDGTGHDASRFGRGHVEIPLLFWFSDGFRASYPDLIESVRENADRPFMTDRLEHTILDLAGVEADLLQPEASLFRAELAQSERRTLDGKLLYDGLDDPAIKAKANLEEIEQEGRPGDRIWAHRVNSLGKLSEVIGLFTGAELDLVFNTERGVFEVRHPPVAETGLSLEDVLSFLRRQDAQIRLWLDLKNVDGENIDEVVSRLSLLDKQYGLKERSIIETGFTGAGLDRLSAQGFYVSYYLPTKRIRTALREGERKDLEQLAAEVAGIVESQRARAISFAVNLRPFVEGHLAAWLKEKELDLLTWDLAVGSSERRFAKHIARRGFDERIKVILVPFSSRFDI